MDNRFAGFPSHSLDFDLNSFAAFHTCHSHGCAVLHLLRIYFLGSLANVVFTLVRVIVQFLGPDQSLENGLK